MGIEAERDHLREVNAELLAALDGLVAKYGDYDLPVPAEILSARAAIAKARGG